MRALGIVAAMLAAVAATAADAQSRRRGGDDPQKKPQGEAPPPVQQKVFPTKVSWVAISLNGKPFVGERPTFILDEQFRMRGFGGCNTFAATAYPLREQKFVVGPFALTKKSCDKAIMDQERNFLIALRTSVTWDTVVGALVIKTQNGEIKFDRVL
ncbi:MAG TPA: META domain-containing protein [Beijerinckiaceae bacterium]|jgi:heat shock protein HslJ